MGVSMARTFTDAAACWKELLANPSADVELLAAVERFARENTRPAQIVFGTSGWRGEIGSDFTFNNVRIVTAAIIEMFKNSDESVMQALGVKDFDEVRRRGIIVGHDNRLLGPEFAMEVNGYLQKEGIRTWYAGEAATPEFSAGVEMLHAACSINLTPSHNPANYAGFKFNPADGGPAGSEITSRIEEIANRMMRESLVLPSIKAGHIEKVDLTSLYLSFITGRKTLDPSSKVVYLRTADNLLFGGIAPEPSEKNMEGVEHVLRECGTDLKLGVIMDPDGDRIRYGDGSMQIPMNYFGAMALHFLYIYKGIQGVAVKSVGTSNLVNAIAEKHGIPVIETKVGFK